MITPTITSTNKPKPANQPSEATNTRATSFISQLSASPAGASLQPVAVETAELQHVSIKGGKQRVFRLYRQLKTEARPGLFLTSLSKQKRDC